MFSTFLCRIAERTGRSDSTRSISGDALRAAAVVLGGFAEEAGELVASFASIVDSAAPDRFNAEEITYSKRPPQVILDRLSTSKYRRSGMLISIGVPIFSKK